MLHKHFWQVLIISILLLLTMCACAPQNVPASDIEGVAFTPSPTLVITSEPDFCSWTWAYGDGSDSFDTAVMEALKNTGITAEVHSTSYGEINSCDQSYNPMCLDIRVDAQTENISDLTALSLFSSKIDEILQQTILVNNIHNICSMNIRFYNPADNSECIWDSQQNQCTL